MTSQDEGATSRPWVAMPDDQGNTNDLICTIWSGKPGHGEIVAYVPVITGWHRRRDMPYEANARLIVTAVNSYDAMRGALEKIAAFDGDKGGNMKKARYIARSTLHQLAQVDGD